ncbi:MAG: transcriptional regulator [Clostridia bacterium]|nr:transcriptional regulator [Clostridia bacterium]MBR3553127.1 transcriptional regulator [Clostridia bacterium]
MKKMNSFETIDYLRALELCARETGTDRRALEEVLLQQRRQELCALVRRVIRCELNEADRRLVVRHWYRGESAAEIADALELDRSTVFRRLAKIERTLYEKLKYAMEYRFGERIAAETGAALHRALPDFAADGGPKNIGKRLKQLRAMHGAALRDVSEQTGILPQRLAALEADGSDLTLEELRSLCRCFDTASDRILFGSDTSPAVNA